MEIYYATANYGKLLSLRRELSESGVKIIQAQIEIPEIRSDDVCEISRRKVLYAYKKIKNPVIALDAGFYINALNGFPRAYVNFALETISLEGILKLMENKDDRSCEFKECLAYCNSPEKAELFLGNAPRTLAISERGKLQERSWSKLDLIFVPRGIFKTLGEMTPGEYKTWKEIFRKENSSSRKFATWLSRNRV